MKIVHLESTLISHFGILDDEGDVIKTIQVKTDGNDALYIRKLTEEAFLNMLKGVLSVREKLSQQLAEEEKNNAPNQLHPTNPD